MEIRLEHFILKQEIHEEGIYMEVVLAFQILMHPDKVGGELMVV